MGGGGFTLTCKIKLKGKMLGLRIEVEEEYPQTPVKVLLLDAYGMSDPLLDAIETSIMTKVE